MSPANRKLPFRKHQTRPSIWRGHEAPSSLYDSGPDRPTGFRLILPGGLVTENEFVCRNVWIAGNPEVSCHCIGSPLDIVDPRLHPACSGDEEPRRRPGPFHHWRVSDGKGADLNRIGPTVG